MGLSDEPEVIRLSVPAQTDFVSVVRLAARVVAGRAGCGDDARSRLLAAIGAAFFALLRNAGGDASVAALLHGADGSVQVELATDDGSRADADQVEALVARYDVTEHDGALRISISA